MKSTRSNLPKKLILFSLVFVSIQACKRGEQLPPVELPGATNEIIAVSFFKDQNQVENGQLSRFINLDGEFQQSVVKEIVPGKTDVVIDSVGNNTGIFWSEGGIVHYADMNGNIIKSYAVNGISGFAVNQIKDLIYGFNTTNTVKVIEYDSDAETETIVPGGGKFRSGTVSSEDGNVFLYDFINSRIVKSSTDLNDATEVITGVSLTGVGDIEYDPSGNIIYWINSSQKKINRYFINTATTEALFDVGDFTEFFEIEPTTDGTVIYYVLNNQIIRRHESSEGPTNVFEGAGELFYGIGLVR